MADDFPPIHTPTVRVADATFPPAPGSPLPYLPVYSRAGGVRAAKPYAVPPGATMVPALVYAAAVAERDAARAEAKRVAEKLFAVGRAAEPFLSQLRIAGTIPDFAAWPDRAPMPHLTQSPCQTVGDYRNLDAALGKAVGA